MMEENKDHWKDIKVEKPPHNQRVLIRTKDTLCVKYYEDVYTECHGWHKAIPLLITHWCELPKGCPTCGKLD